jgi:pyocin large subunit-like protein
LVEVTGVGRDAVRSALTNLQTVGLIADTGDRAGPTGRTVVWQIVEVPAETLRDRLESHDYTHRKRRPLSGRLANPAVAGRGAPAEVWPDENRPPPDWAADREGDG